MEFHQLRYFVAVADEGSFSRAAARERVAQPSLSQQVQKLEFELGQPLFDRLPRGAILTQAGEQLLVYAKRILAEAANARNALASGTHPLAGRVALGMIPTIAPFLLPPLAAGFRTRHPQVEIEIIEDVTLGLVRRLEVGELDLAAVSTVHAANSVVLEQIGVESLLVLAGSGFERNRQGRVSWSDLADEPFLVLHEMHCLSGQMMEVCHQQHIQPKVVFKGAQLDTVARLVASGAGISMVPAMMAATDPDKSRVYLPLNPPEPTRPLNLAWNPHRHRTAQALALAQEIRATLALLAPNGVEIPAETGTRKRKQGQAPSATLPKGNGS